MLTFTAFQLALIAVVYAVILIEPGMLLGTLYQRLQDFTLNRWNKYPDEIYWLKPLISCVKCVAGQWAFWYYIIIFEYSFLEHLYFTGLSIFLASFLAKLYRWTQHP